MYLFLQCQTYEVPPSPKFISGNVYTKLDIFIVLPYQKIWFPVMKIKANKFREGEKLITLTWEEEVQSIPLHSKAGDRGKQLPHLALPGDTNDIFIKLHVCFRFKPFSILS